MEPERIPPLTAEERTTMEPERIPRLTEEERIRKEQERIEQERIKMELERIPLLTKDNYGVWEQKMDQFLQSEGLADDNQSLTALNYIQKRCGTRARNFIRGLRSGAEARKQLAIMYDGTQASKAEGQNSSTNFTWCLPLYRAIVDGKWEKVTLILDGKDGALIARLTSEAQTPLHIAVQKGRAKVVEELLKMVTPESLSLRDIYGRTPLHIAASGENKNIVEHLVEKSKDPLLMLIDDTGFPDDNIPVNIAVRASKKDIVDVLYRETMNMFHAKEEAARGDRINNNKDPYAEIKAGLITSLIFGDFYDLALDLLRKYPNLYKTKDLSGKMALQALSQKPSAFQSSFPTNGCFGILGSLIYQCITVETLSGLAVPAAPALPVPPAVPDPPVVPGTPAPPTALALPIAPVAPDPPVVPATPALPVAPATLDPPIVPAAPAPPAALTLPGAPNPPDVPVVPALLVASDPPAMPVALATPDPPVVVAAPALLAMPDPPTIPVAPDLPVAPVAPDPPVVPAAPALLVAPVVPNPPVVPAAPALPVAPAMPDPLAALVLPVAPAALAQPVAPRGDIENPMGGCFRHRTEVKNIWHWFDISCAVKNIWHWFDWLLWTIVKRVLGVETIYHKKKTHVTAKMLLEELWNLVAKEGDDLEEDELVSAIFEATQFGIVEFIDAVIKNCPQLMWRVDKETKRSIFHSAILYRQEKIFHQIRELGPMKFHMTKFADKYGNYMLHLAAYLSPPKKLNLYPGPALKMQHEVRWYKEVQSIVPPTYEDFENKVHKTPIVLFREEHGTLLKEAKSWMKATATQCMVVTTLIATIMFAAAFTVPGVNGSKISNIFVASEVLALSSSVASLLIFLIIITSCHAEEDFFKSLPQKLSWALLLLLISVVCMMIAFVDAIWVFFHHDTWWIPLLILLLAIVPVTAKLLVEFRLYGQMILPSWIINIFRV